MPSMTMTSPPEPAKSATPAAPPTGRSISASVDRGDYPGADPAGGMAERGETRIAAQVVEKIAARAAAEIEAVGGAAQRILGVALGADTPDRDAKVTAHVDGRVVILDVHCSIVYPAPVAATTQRLREHLAERIGTPTGLDTRQVDITVVALPAPAGRPGRGVE
jgi:uncharacterized alkaline shock family protein YloU